MTESPTERELGELLSSCRYEQDWDLFNADPEGQWLATADDVFAAVASWHDAKVAELKAENERLRESFDEFGPDCAHDNHQPYCRHYKGLRQRLARLTEAARKLKEAVWRACDWPEGGRVDDASEALDAILNEQETA